MARVDKLPLRVLESVATRTANTLANFGISASSAAAGHKSLHESLPIWLMTGPLLERLRADRNAPTVDIRKYMYQTNFWLHIVQRNGEPFGLVHGKQRFKLWQTVTNISVTREAVLIRQAIDLIDRTFTNDSATAGIFECPKVGLAGIILLPKKREEELRICIFRDPIVANDWSPESVVNAKELIERLLQLHVVKGPRRGDAERR